MSKRSPQPQPQPERSNRPRAVSELVPAVGGAAFKRFGFVQSAVVSRWGEIVGPRWAALCQPESIRFPPGKRSEGVLTVAVAGAHAPMLQHILPEIVERQGELPRREKRAAPPSVRPVPAELGEGLRQVADPELRQVLESLAAGVAATRGLPRVS
jgi:hypothetical protein